MHLYFILFFETEGHMRLYLVYQTLNILFSVV